MAVLLLPLPAAFAGTLWQPVGVSTDMGSFATFEPIYAIDQSGLAVGYVSGVTDFDAFVGATATVNGGASFTTWFSQTSITGNFDFDLGQTVTIESFALWADPQGIGQTVKLFNLLADDNPQFSSPTLLGAFHAADGTDDDATNFGQVFGFTPTAAAYVRMQIVSNHGSGLTSGFVEAAFEVAAIPLPPALLMFAPALYWLAARTRRA